ncbi:MAG: hypothetical protein NTU54_00490 [Candidatus Omnitrophica bacterium]|nr:hypothetical protein [Candidatus Omnitrophota bacterium]
MYRSKAIKKLIFLLKDSSFRILLEHLKKEDRPKINKNIDFIEWIHEDLVLAVKLFTEEQGLLKSRFVRCSNMIFRTEKFSILLQRWLVDYLGDLFNLIYDYEHSCLKGKYSLPLEDNPLNRFAIKRYESKFGVKIPVPWKPALGNIRKALSIFLQNLFIIYHSVKTGVVLFAKKETYKVMHESLWGLFSMHGYYFHDDFFVDGKVIMSDDLLLFSRAEIHHCSQSMKAMNQARGSSYASFYLPDLPISLIDLLLRVLPRYIFFESFVFISEIRSKNFSLFQSIFYYFSIYGLPYEKVFSNFNINAELGHGYFIAQHIPEAIVCNNRGAKYYLIHWSDNSVDLDKHILSFLGCDRFFLWGPSHVQGVEGNPEMLEFTGYFFKKFIKDIKINRKNVLKDMQISARGKVISFFDESFGANCIMTGMHYVNFWKLALESARLMSDHTIVIKPKGLYEYRNLPNNLIADFLEVKDELSRRDNVFFVDDERWSFVECIGISDLVITQGMTSSATIAIICGINGLYFAEAEVDHIFSRHFKDKLVFDSAVSILKMIRRIVDGDENPLHLITENIMRGLDAYKDDSGLDNLKRILSGVNS